MQDIRYERMNTEQGYKLHILDTVRRIQDTKDRTQKKLFKLHKLDTVCRMQDTETEHMHNAGYKITKIRGILSRKCKTENIFVHNLQRSQKVRFPLLHVGYRYKIRVHDSGCRLLNVKLPDTQFLICCVVQMDKKSQRTVKKINTILGTVGYKFGTNFRSLVRAFCIHRYLANFVK